MPLSQQPVFMHADSRAPQPVTQAETATRAVFLQAVIHAFSSPLHFIGSADADCAPKKARAKRAALASFTAGLIMDRAYSRVASWLQSLNLTRCIVFRPKAATHRRARAAVASL